MKIRVYKKIESGVYKVSVTTEEWSEGDKLLMADYGEPRINEGGTFAGGETDYITFTLPDAYVRIMSEVPFTQGFDSRDIADAEAYADVWATEIITRIGDAVETLRNYQDTFTGETVINV